MRTKYIFVLVLFFCAFSFFSCQKSPLEISKLEADFSYLPLEVGSYQIYLVKQTIYRLNELPLKQQYQVKEVVEAAVKTEGNRDGFRLFRYKRTNGLQNWALDSVWSARLEPDHIVRNEHNVQLVKLRFPFSEGKKWNGNLYNDGGERNYVMQNLGKDYEISGKKYDETVTVFAQSDSSKIDKKVLFEIYAKGIGLVYKKHEFLLYCNPDQPELSDCFGKKIIESGIISEVLLLENGKE